MSKAPNFRLLDSGLTGGRWFSPNYNVYLRLRLEGAAKSEYVIQAIDPNARRICGECALY